MNKKNVDKEWRRDEGKSHSGNGSLALRSRCENLFFLGFYVWLLKDWWVESGDAKKFC